jgi:hypothetical protein
MANVTITQLPAASSVATGDEFPIMQGGASTRKGTVAQLTTALSGQTGLSVANYGAAADVAAITVPSSVNAIRTTGFATFGDGGDALYKRVAGAPAHAGYVQSADGAYWEIQLGNGAINVKAFGATGDGVTADAAAINAAITAAATVDYASIYMPAGVYMTGSTTIPLPANVSIIAENGALVEYSGTGDCFLVESSIDYTFMGREYRFPRIRKGHNSTPVWNSGTDLTSTGIHITGGMQNCDVFIPGVLLFSVGVFLDCVTATQNIVCNNFYLGRLNNNRIGLHMLGDTTGTPYGVNQNQFIGGSIRIDTAYTTADPCWKILMVTTECNTNTFLGTNLETGPTTELGISCDGSANIFINMRLEGAFARTGFLTFSATAQNNRFFGGAGSYATLVGPFDAFVADAGFGNVYHYGDTYAGKMFRIDWQDTYALWFGNGTVAPAVPIRGYSTDRLQIGNASTSGTRFFGGMWQEERVQTTGTSLTGYSNHYQLTYASPTTIIGAAGACVDQTLGFLVSIVSTNGNVTLQHDSTPTAGDGHFVNLSGADLLLTANVPVIYIQMNGSLYQAV